MTIDSILKKVIKPSRYKPIETIPYVFSEENEKLAVFNLGNYESQISSLDFQTLFALLAESKKFQPFRFFMPDYDFLYYLKTKEIPDIWSIDNDKNLSDFNFFIIYLNGDESLYQLLILRKLLPSKSKKIIIQNSKVISPVVKDSSDLLLCGTDFNKLKLFIQKSTTLIEFFDAVQEKAINGVFDFDNENSMGALAKYIVPIINVKAADNLFRYIYLCHEYNRSELFDQKSKSNEAIMQSSQKRLNDKILNLPNENEISIFPLGVSDRIQEFLNIQKTYRSAFISIKKLLSLGYRSIHLYYWIGHPLEDRDDWSFFKKQVSAIHDYTKDFKKITIYFHFGTYCPSSSSEFLWDDVYTPEQFNSKKEELKRLFSDRDKLLCQFETFTAHFMRVFALRGDSADYENLLFEFEAFYQNSNDLSAEAFFQNHLADNEKFNSLFQAQAYGRINFNILNSNEDGIIELQNKRKSVSSRLLEKVQVNELDFNITIVKKALPNLNCFVSKTQDSISGHLAEEEMSFGRSVKRRAAQQQDFARKFRIKYKKFDRVIYYTGTDLRNIFIKSFENLKIPIIYTKGFTPSPKIAFAAPASQGIESNSEFFDIEINTIKDFDLKESLNSRLPLGLEVIEYKEIPLKKESLASRINANSYVFDFSALDINDEDLNEWIKSEEKNIHREHKGVKLILNINDFMHDAIVKENKLTLILKNIEQRMIKAEEILFSIVEFKTFDSDLVPVLRQAQFILNNNGSSTEVMEL
jgi:radical SAM-linked protein